MLFAMSAAVVCVPALAESSSAHCSLPADNAQPSTPEMDCCVASSHEPPAVPDQSPASGPGSGKSAAGLDRTVDVPATTVASGTGRAPTDAAARYHPRDLTTLYAVFLI
jgi:hypothetical protein